MCVVLAIPDDADPADGFLAVFVCLHGVFFVLGCVGHGFTCESFPTTGELWRVHPRAQGSTGSCTWRGVSLAGAAASADLQPQVHRWLGLYENFLEGAWQTTF